MSGLLVATHSDPHPIAVTVLPNKEDWDYAAIWDGNEWHIAVF